MTPSCHVIMMRFGINKSSFLSKSSLPPTLAMNDERLPCLHEKTKSKFLVCYKNMGLCLYITRWCDVWQCFDSLWIGSIQESLYVNCVLYLWWLQTIVEGELSISISINILVIVLFLTYSCDFYIFKLTYQASPK